MLKNLCIFIMLLFLIACRSTSDDPIISEVDPFMYTVQERREAFMKAIWGDVQTIGYLHHSPFPNIRFTRTIILSFEDKFFFTLAIFEHHPYLINPDETLEVYIAHDTTFNLLSLPGNFDQLRRQSTEDGTTIVSGFHNGIFFEIEFEEVSDYD